MYKCGNNSEIPSTEVFDIRKDVLNFVNFEEIEQIDRMIGKAKRGAGRMWCMAVIIMSIEIIIQ